MKVESDQQIAPFAIGRCAYKPLRKFLPKRTNRLRASQNAAVLLFDFDTVDIR
jgi:hypothetical protein